LADTQGNQRVYVIGDIHGRSDLLDQMIQQIERDLDRSPVVDGLTVTLGDYVDRGPNSRGVLDRLANNPFPTKYVALKGNHEELFEAFLHDPMVASHWRRYGGLETLHSYGVSVAAVMIGKGFEEASEALRQAVPPEHLRFLASLKLAMSVGDYFLCHAGVRPGIPLEHQSAQDLLWIRDEFLNSTMSFGKIVVHGHTPIASPEVLPTRINIDTGAFATGRLTCLILEGENRRFLSTG
jgi:diadenosine tetraphosphatase ApaH/serine/threonine PP2A family protein phosphatase